jgi:DNA-binding NarL/FixJ family response regulator
MDHPARVVVVAGHPVMLGVVRLACESLRNVVIVGEGAGAGEAALLVETLRPDLLVLDLELPDLDGLDVLRELRATGYDGPALVLSERADGGTVLEALRLGAEGFVHKAEGMRHVGEAIRRVIAGERAVGPELEQAAVMELGRFARQAREGSAVDAALTERERQILELLADGFTMQQIGRRLGISPRTVETHVAKLYRKLGVSTRVQAIARAASLGLVELR